MLTATRSPSPSPSCSRSRSHPDSRTRSTSPTDKNPLSAPPTWRSKFAKVKPLQRYHLKISSPIPISTKRWSSNSTSSATSTESATSDISLASSTVEYGKAEIIEIVRPTARPKLVDARSPMTTQPGQIPRQATANNRKLLEYFGVRQSDREAVAMQRAGITTERVSAFREEFDSPEQVQRKRREDGDGVTGIKAEGKDGGVGRASEEELSEGLVKWFRCDIFPTDAPAFHSAEAEAKRLVVEGGGRVMGQWTYPGGFMFQIARNLPSPLPPTIPSATPTRAAKILLSYLGEDGSLRATEFQPHLEPMQHLLSMSTSAPNTPNSGTSSSTIRPTSKNDDLLSAIEYINSASVEEIPLLRTSPVKSDATPQTKQRQSWQTSTAASPEAKGKLQLWLQKQQGSQPAKKKREGQVYDLSARHRAAMLRKIEEEEDEWESDDGESGSGSEKGSGSEFSIATGLESVKFVAECGSLF